MQAYKTMDDLARILREVADRQEDFARELEQEPELEQGLKNLSNEYAKANEEYQAAESELQTFKIKNNLRD